MKNAITNKRVIVIRLLLLILVLTISGVILAALKSQAMTEKAEETYNPVIVDAPLYVECQDGKPVEVRLTPKEDMSVDYLNLLFVNTSEKGEGRLTIEVKDDDGETLAKIITEERHIPTGSWNKYGLNLMLSEGSDIVITLTAQGFAPYLIQAPLSEIERSMPFSETVSADGVSLPTGVSLGIGRYYDRVLTYGDIFYWSDYLVILFAAAAIAVILLGFRGIKDICKVFSNTDVPTQYANDVCLILVWLYIGLNIFKYAYAEAVCISADSAGYLREAVNLCAGNGFSYDGLAGYSSWFANWPILYPLLIAAAAGVTGLDVYIASKVLSVLLVGIILLLLRIVYKRNAWIYSLALLNLGFIEIAQYTWSETPFMLFILLFGLVLGKILSTKEIEWYWYPILAFSYAGAYLSRYFGIFLIAPLGLAIAIVILLYHRTKEASLRKKWIGLTATAAFDCALTLIYMLINKVNNGKASGVSRNMWWDDYKSLTNDLIQSLLTEFFNALGIDIPASINRLTFGSKALIITIITCVIAWAVVMLVTNLKKANKRMEAPAIRELVLITLACIYICMFIVIRYRSSMDTFYFRFFEPATFMLTIGLLGLVVPHLTDNVNRRIIPQFAMIMILLIMSVGLIKDTKWDYRDSFYGVTTRAWDEAYKEIPEKSVVIFSALDYRSEYYRPDVVGGTIEPGDTLESLWERYYGSEYICVRTEDAKIMVAEGDYAPEIKEMLEACLQNAYTQSYIVIGRN